MKLRMLICFVVSLVLGVLFFSIKINALSSSLDGTLVVYEKEEQIYLKNFNNNTISYISDGKMPTLSSDGRFIVFSSTSFSDKKCPSLLENTKEECVDIIIYDRLNETYENKTKDFNNHSYNATMSSNGNYLVIETLASNIKGLVSSCQSYYSNQKRSCSNIITLDLNSNEIKIITNNTNYDSFDPKISGDGQSIVFRSFHPFNKDLKKICYNDYLNSNYYCSTIYLYKDDKIKRISLGKNDAYNALISDDGNYITYQSYDIEIEDYHHYYNSIYKYNIYEDKKTLITDNPNREVENIFLSKNGSLIGIITEANNLTDQDSFENKYIIYNEDTKTFKNQVNTNDATSNLDGKTIFYFSNGEISKISYNNIIVKREYDTYFLVNSSYNLTKNIVIPDDCKFRIVDVGNFSINKEGEYPITIEVFNDNSTILYSYTVYVLDEDESPYFECSDLYKVEAGNTTFSLANNIKVFDKIDGPLTYQVVNYDNFNIYQEGTYKIVLKAIDTSNNITYKTISIEVYKKKQNNFLGLIGSILLFGTLGIYIFNVSLAFS